MSLTDIINVQTHISAATVIQEGFDVGLVLAHHNHWSERVREYDSSSWQQTLKAELFDKTEPAYLAVAAMMKQSPRPKTFKIGRRATVETQILHITPTVSATAAYVHKLKIGAADGTIYPIEFAQGLTPTVGDICTGLADAINAADLDMTADGASGTHIILTADDENTLHEIYDFTSTLTVLDETVVDGVALADDLDAIAEEDDDWYGLALASPAPAAIEACADWVETRRKIFPAFTHDGDVLSASENDIASSIKSQNYGRTHVAYNRRVLSMMGPAWLAVMLTYEPGQATWMFKTLKGVYADKLTANQEAALEDKYASYYQHVLGTANSGEGKAGDGIYLDLTQLADWAWAKTEEGIVGMLRASPKVKLTDADAGAKIYGTYKNVIEMGQQNGAIKEEEDTWTVNVPKIAELPDNDRINRRYTGTSFSFTATGAVHGVDVVNIYVNV